MSCVTLVKAALARFLFGIHTLITVWRVVINEGDSNWIHAIGILILFLEGLHSLCYRRGEEFKWFCPSVFIYLYFSIVPAIWKLELKTDRRVLLCQYIKVVVGQNSTCLLKDMRSPLLLKNLLMDLMQMKEEDFEDARHACDGVEIPKEAEQRFQSSMEKVEVLDFKLNIALKPEQWTRILEQIVLVVLILGRWLLPKGKLSRDQFSQLMLVYIGMAADIVEIFEAFRESKVMLEPTLTYAILGVWSWSLLQFCLVLGGSHRGKKSRMGLGGNNSTDLNMETTSVHPAASTTSKRSSSRKKQKSGDLSDISDEKRKRIQMDMIVIVTSLLLQDFPFFCLRMTLIFRFQVISHMNIFFTCKNSLVIMLQVYRFFVLCLERRPVYRRQSRIFSLIPSPPPPYGEYNDQDDVNDETTNHQNEEKESKPTEHKTGSRSHRKRSERVKAPEVTKKASPQRVKRNSVHIKRSNGNQRQKSNRHRAHQPYPPMKSQNTFPSTNSDDLPPSTSEDSENIPALMVSQPGRFLLAQDRSGSLKSLASQVSTESVQDYIRDREDQWRRKHSSRVLNHNPAATGQKKVRTQTLI